MEVLAADVEEVTLVMPGASTPAELLAAAQLPPLPAMLSAAMNERCDYARGTSVSVHSGGSPRADGQPPSPHAPAPGTPQPPHTSHHRGKAEESAAQRGSAAHPPQAGASADGPAAAKSEASDANVPDPAAKAAAQAANKKQQRHVWWKRHTAGVIDLNTPEQDGPAMPTRAAGVLNVRMPGDGPAVASADSTADEQKGDAGPAEPAEQRGGGSSSAAGVGGGAPATKEPEQQALPRGHQHASRPSPTVRLSSGWRPAGTAASAPAKSQPLRPGQTPFGAPQLQQQAPTRRPARQALACRSFVRGSFP